MNAAMRRRDFVTAVAAATTAAAQTIADPGYTGYISHEFRPAPGRDPIESLKQAMEIMDV